MTTEKAISIIYKAWANEIEAGIFWRDNESAQIMAEAMDILAVQCGGTDKWHVKIQLLNTTERISLARVTA